LGPIEVIQGNAGLGSCAGMSKFGNDFFWLLERPLDILLISSSLRKLNMNFPSSLSVPAKIIFRVASGVLAIEKIGDWEKLEILPGYKTIHFEIL